MIFGLRKGWDIYHQLLMRESITKKCLQRECFGLHYCRLISPPFRLTMDYVKPVYAFNHGFHFLSF